MADDRIRDWSRLPSDLLFLIITYLIELPDLIRFSCVCSQWRSIINNHPQNSKHHHHRLPWLLLPFPSIPQSLTLDGNLRFLSLSEHRIYSFSLPETLNNHLIFTSAHGWLVAVSYDPRKKLSFLKMLNPITRHTIFLPPLFDLTLSLSVKLLKSPSSNDDDDDRLIVVVKCLHLYIFRVGDSTWKKVHHRPNNGFYLEYTIHNGQLFAFDSTSETHVLDLDTFVCVAKIPATPNITFSIDYCNLVETPYGELYLVARQLRTRMFAVLRLEESEEEREWREVESFGYGGYSLFQNRYHTMCFVPRGFEGWKTDCVYFVEPLKVKASGESEEPGLWFLDVERQSLVQVQLSFDKQLIGTFDGELFVPSF